MRVLCALLLCVASVLGAVNDAEIENIDKVDAKVFNDGLTSVEAPSNTQLRAMEDSELLAEKSVEDTLGESSADTGGEDQTLYSFRAMKQASSLAGSSVTEKAEETHAAAQRFLREGMSADKMFEEINREQQILSAKKALVARQKQSIADSVEALTRLRSLINDNKAILKKNEGALRRASQDLLQLITKYEGRLKAGLGSNVTPLKYHPHQKAAAVKGTASGANVAAKKKAQLAKLKADAKLGKKAAKKLKASEKVISGSGEAPPMFFKSVDSDEEHDDSEEEVEVEADDETEADDESEAESEDEDADSEDSEDSDALLEQSGRISRAPVVAGLNAPPQWETEEN